MIQKWTEAVALAARIVIGDNDAPGRMAGGNRALLIAADQHFPSEQFKDLDEWILADQENAKKTFREWYGKTLTNWWW